MHTPHYASASVHTQAHAFLDRVRLSVSGGSGGKGLVSFESLTNIKKRPMGGNGGRGGDVVIEASQAVRDLHFPHRHIVGRNGTDASGKGNSGRAGKTLRILVPIGTVVKEVERDYMFEGEEELDADEMDESMLMADHAHAEEDGHQGESEEEREHANMRDEGRSGRQHRRSGAASRALEWDDESSGEEEEACAEERTETRGRRRRRRMRSRLEEEQADEEQVGDESVHEEAEAANAANEPPVLPRREREAAGIMKSTQSGLMYREKLQVLADLDRHGQSILVARGGLPGIGNKGSMLTYAETLHGVNKPHTAGSPGETRFVELELKSIADVGLVGFPNAGKSSLLGALSKAKPKVADYPFTTLHPTVGVVHFSDTHTITVADIPGLIEGAHQDRGLGHDFLRHIERTRVLAYVLDASGKHSDPVADLHTLQRELQLYDENLPRRPSLIVANKLDVPGGAQVIQRLRAATSLPVLPASALMRSNIGEVAGALRWLLDALERTKSAGAR